jgi:Tol biopolymer transport system component
MKAALNSFTWCLLAFIFAALSVCRAAAAQPVSVAGVQSKLGGSGDSGLAIISQNGRYVLFGSTANNLTPTNNNDSVLPCCFNVFLRDMLSNTTTLVSANIAGTGGGNGDSFPTGISTNGQFALFESGASDLIANDTNNASDIFVRDLVNGTTTLVSVSTTGGSANGVSRGSVITPDGRYVAFTSAATNLVSADTNNIADVFVRDLSLGTTTLVSVGARTNASPPSANIATSSESPEITPDGRYVVFYSTATNLVSGVKTAGEIYVRDLIAGNAIWASTNARAIFKLVTGGTNIVSCNYSISDDGQFVAFEACTNLSGTSSRGIILRQSLLTGATDIIHTNANVPLLSYELVHNLSMTPDGRFIAFVGNLPVASTTTNAIYVWDAQTGTNTLVSVSLDNVTPANGICDSPVISANGQFVAYTSSATNLTTNTLAGDRHVYFRDLQAGITQLLDADTNGTGVGVDATTVPAMSADGSVVAFDSANLLPDNRHLVHDVFTRNVTTGAISLVSAANPTLSSETPNGISGFTTFSVSSNGQFVAFYSDADNLVANDTNGFRDVFVRDLVGGTTILVSVNTNGIASGDGISTDPAISGDGRFVAFTSAADNLVPSDTNRSQDVFLRDLQAGTTALVSVALNGVSPGNGDSVSPVISADGRYVLFHSKASNLAAGSFGSGIENLFFRDLQTGTTYPLTSSGVISAAMTPDGQSVAFIGGAVGISTPQLYVWNSSLNGLTYTNSNGTITFYAGSFQVVAISPNGQKIAFVTGTAQYLYGADLVANTTAKISSGNSVFNSHTGVRFSNDGRFLTYATASLNSSVQNIYLYDFQTGTNLLVSQSFNSTTITNGNSDSPNISPDGRFIAYRSLATNIVPFDSNNVADLFLYDAVNNDTILLSVNAAGNASASDRSLLPVFSADGRMLFFQSWAADLVGNDFNCGSDLFALDLARLPVTTGTGGGATNAASGFSAQLIVPIGVSNSAPAINWPLAAGKSYQVQYKTNLNDAVWLNLPGNVTFIGATGYLNDALPSPGQRFYRIVLNP